MSHEVFISYSSKNKPAADAVCAALEAAGMGCWIAPRDIRPGEDWPAGIMRGLQAMKAMVLIFSADANTSPQILREVERAVNRNVPLVPFRIDVSKPSGSFEYFLMVPHWLEAANPPKAQHLDGLVRTVQGILSAQKGTDPAPIAGGAPPVQPVTPRRPSRKPIWTAVAAILLVGLTAGLWAALGPGKSKEPVVPKGTTPITLVPAPAVVPPTSGPATAPARVELPEWTRGLAARQVLEIAYQRTPPAATVPSSLVRLQMGLIARRKGAAGFSPLLDGESLTSEVDTYSIAALPKSDGYLYIFQMDSGGQVQWLFPKNAACPVYSSGSNPVAAGKVVQVPPTGSGEALTLDHVQGVEHIYFVLSATAWPELESALSRPTPPVTIARIETGRDIRGVVTKPAGLDARGVGGKVSVTDAAPVDASQLFGQNFGGKSGAGEAEAAGGFVVAERWFKHVGVP